MNTLETKTRYEGTPRGERACGWPEYAGRRLVSSVLYFRLWRHWHPETPFYTPRAIRTVEMLINPATRVFEWGSGASTLWYAQRVAMVVSIEHDEYWFRRGIVALAEKGITNTELMFVPPGQLSVSGARQMLQRTTSEYPADEREYLDYVLTIDRYPDGHFHCIAIDGRARVACLLHALPKLAEGGAIVLDDSHRPRYQHAFEILANWRKQQFDFGLLQTTIFTRE